MSTSDPAPSGKPRVVFVATDLSTGGGVNKVIRDLAVLFRTLLPADVTVVSARSDRPSSYAFCRGVPVQMHRRGSLFRYFRVLLTLRRSRPDFVISSWTQDNILVTLAFLFVRSKVVLVEHSPWHLQKPIVRMLRAAVYPLAWRIVVLNRSDLAHYRRSTPHVRLIPNPVPAPSAPVSVRREKLVLAVGHLEPLKQFDQAIRAMTASRLEDDGWTLAIIGSGREEGRLRKLIEESGLKRAHIHSAGEDLGAWYARASLLLVTSRTESFSLVLAEAMLSGVVPIAYATDGPSFILENFPEHLVPIGDEKRLAERLRYFAVDASREDVVQRLAQSAQARFSPEVIAREWKNLLFEAKE